MTGESCLNCGEPAEDVYDLLVRGSDYRDVPLCETCAEGLRRELGDALRTE